MSPCRHAGGAPAVGGRSDSIAGVAVFVVLSLALVVAVLGAVGVVAVHLLRGLRSLSGAVQHSRQRLQPLTEELQAEAAVAALESDALQRSLEVLRDSRSPRRGIPRPVTAEEPGSA